ncbi:MAG: hypothetical protein SFV21_12625 [Rhodospirillaceae bacterium]|nr:hypothetical protein [Rhodospirillaceae bacterium]
MARNREKPAPKDIPIRTSLQGRVGRRRDVEAIRAEAWRAHGALAIPASDPRLTFTERLAIEAAGTRIYGPRQTSSRPDVAPGPRPDVAPGPCPGVAPGPRR